MTEILLFGQVDLNLCQQAEERWDLRVFSSFVTVHVFSQVTKTASRKLFLFSI